MVCCSVCGGEDFEKHAGFMYCAVCQTQSQEYQEQEYDYHDYSVTVTKHAKSLTTSAKTKKSKFYDGGFWTTWEGFNYILYGMTEEMKKCRVTKEFEEVVFKLWAAYLKECQVAFFSRNQEKTPKLRFNFRQRDARILYNIDLPTYSSRERESRKKRISCSSRISNASFSSISSQSKRSISLQKTKIVEADYREQLSLSTQSVSNLANETLESLGRSSELEMTDKNSDGSETLAENFKLVLANRDYKAYKNASQSKKFLMNAKDKCKKDIQTLGKNKLLSIIHLALLMTGSEIQLSDLLRFIRESHLSFAKVTHFFPPSLKFPKKDLAYTEVTSDTLMPTHLRQRKITSELAHMLKINYIATPDMNKLVNRYCQDLNLPQQIADWSLAILNEYVPPFIRPKSKTLLPCFEAWAVASIIFVIKLLFGLNDKSEIFLSRLAREINSATNNDPCAFVFEDWQKFIECRKTVLTNFHYPTQEQLGENFFDSSKKFLEVLLKESKDDYRNYRFIPYSKYFIEEKLLSGVKRTLGALSEPQGDGFIEFKPSLIPQVSHTKAIIQCVSQESDEREEKILYRTIPPPTKDLPTEILQKNFKNCDLKFVFNPEGYLNLVNNTSDLLAEFEIGNEFNNSKDKDNRDFLFNCSSEYWVFKYPNSTSNHLNNFKEEILEKTPENFQWLITECARMLEMNVRDVYDELLRLEKKLRSVTEVQT